MSAGTDIKTWQERLFAQQPQTRDYPTGVMHECGAAYKDAEIADLRAALEEAEHQRGALAQAIADAVTKAGMWNGEVGLTGPHLIMFCDDMASVIASQPDSERDAALVEVGHLFIGPSGTLEESMPLFGIAGQQPGRHTLYIKAAQQGEEQPLPGDKP